MSTVCELYIKFQSNHYCQQSGFINNRFKAINKLLQSGKCKCQFKVITTGKSGNGKYQIQSNHHWQLSGKGKYQIKAMSKSQNVLYRQKSEKEEIKKICK